MSYTLKVEYNENTDEYYVILPQKLLEEVGWKAGDQLKFTKRKDGSLIVKKAS